MNNTRRVDAQLKTARHSMLSASPFQSVHFQTVELYVDVQLQTEDDYFCSRCHRFNLRLACAFKEVDLVESRSIESPVDSKP